MLSDKKRHALLNANNSAARVFLIPDGSAVNDDELCRVALTTEPDLYVALRGRADGCERAERQEAVRATSMHNAEDTVTAEKLDLILKTMYDDQEFNQKYNYASLFLIGSGSYGYVFRIVSHAAGSVENPLYDERYVRFLQSMRRTKSRKKAALLDSYRDSLCLDLVAMKVEALSSQDVNFQSANKIQLVKEFCMLAELFRSQSSTNALVGFPLPIEFGFLGSQRAAKNLKKVLIFDMYGRPSNYQDALLGESSILNLAPADVTNVSYMAMELLGPNLDEWKAFFLPSHGQVGRLVFSVQTTLKLMDQVLCRLLVMHRRNMVHLDLKPDNLCMGIGKMTNTVYLLDYGLSRICSDEKPTITLGSRRYMSVGVMSLWPANFMMDIESWFYVLIVLLTDFVPWSDEALNKKFGNTISLNCERRMKHVSDLKRQFWGDDEALAGEGRRLFQQVVDIAESMHRSHVPDIGAILTDIYSHVRRMRQDFYRVSSLRMHADIRNEESDLFKRYHMLRKLLLFPYDCQFVGKDSCFAQDKDLARKQEKRRSLHNMLIFAENGRNWYWDWDVWFEDEFVGENPSVQNEDTLKVDSHNSAPASQQKLTASPILSHCQSNAAYESDEAREPEEPTERAEPWGSGIPDWMRHYLARVLGSMATQASQDANSQPQTHGRVAVAS